MNKNHADEAIEKVPVDIAIELEVSG